MARTKTKSGSKVKTTCPICGKVLTRAGMIGHMHWKHGKVYNAPLLDKPKPMQYQEARRKAELYDDGMWPIVLDLVPVPADKLPSTEAHHLVHLRDEGVIKSAFRRLVSDAAKRIQAAQKVSFNEALAILNKAVQDAINKA
jgi:hypothetical protein